MKAIFFFLVASLALPFLMKGDALTSAPLPKGGKEEEIVKIFNQLPGINRPFTINPYVRISARLQKMGQAKGFEELTKLAEHDENGRVMILCRLIYSKKGNTSFRPPGVGSPVCLGDTSADDWSLSPIVLVDNVPIYVIYGYRFHGEPETSLEYLNFCNDNCEWSTLPFNEIDDKKIEASLRKLLNSDKWKRPLLDYERDYLKAQFKP